MAMAVARDLELRRTVSTTASMDSESTFSLTETEAADIDAVVNKRWQIEEVIGLLQTKVAILTGGRDKRGGSVITLTATEQTDLRPTYIGKLLSYLGKVPDESLQGLGFTLLLDMRQASWQVTKKALKSLQLTFVEHIYQVFVLKPKSFWQRQKTGVSFTLKKSQFNFTVILLEHSSDIFQYLQVSQVTKEIGGTLAYDHQEWIETQRQLEKHQLELLQRIDNFERLREQLEQKETPESLNEARDAVRRHVEARQQLDKTALDSLCEVVEYSVAKLRPCANPDFIACFYRLEEMCTCLQAMRDRLEKVWGEKGTKLDRALQLRVFESDSDQLLRWIHDESASLSREHTTIGDSVTSAERHKQAFDDFRTRTVSRYREMNRIRQLGERLIAGKHPAAETFRGRSTELRSRWETFSAMVEERASLLTLSVVFHDRQQRFFYRVEGWVEECSVQDGPTDIAGVEVLLRQHKQLREDYQEFYSVVRRDGHGLIEKLRKPVGESSLPANFIIGTRHVKETLELLYDEMSLLEEQWERKNTTLKQTLNLGKFQEETKKVFSWISDVGNPFLSSCYSIGEDTGATQRLLKKHDTFDTETEKIYGVSNQLFAKAHEMGASGECNRERIQEEGAKLERAVHSFASRLDERREIILHTFGLYQKFETLSSEMNQISRPIPREKFSGSPSKIESRLRDFQTRRQKLDNIAMDAFTSCESLMERLTNASRMAKEAGTSINYSMSLASLKLRLEEAKGRKREVDESCDHRETRWKLTVQLDQFQVDVQQHLSEVESWSQQHENTSWEPASNTVIAQQQLEPFQKWYNQLHASHEELVSRGRSIATQIDQSDSTMFGPSDSTHSAVVCVDEHVEKMEKVMGRMDTICRPKLQQMRDCLQFYLLQQRASKLTTALSNLSSILSQATVVGHTLEEAQSLWQHTTETNQKLKAVGDDVEGFSVEVGECMESGHYQSTLLSTLARSLQEKLSGVSKMMTEKMRVTRASLEFHQNVNKFSSTMEQCYSQFSSRDTGKSVSDAGKLLAVIEELRTLLEQSAEVVQSHGRKLLEILPMTPVANGNHSKSTSLDSPVVERRREKSSPSLQRARANSDTILHELGKSPKTSPQSPRRQGSLDILENSSGEIATILEDTDAPNTSNENCPDSPRQLVMPRRKRPPLSTSTSAPSLPPSEEQQMVENILQKMELRLQKLLELWQGRKSRLEQSRRVVEFREAVPPVLEWIDYAGMHYLEAKHSYGRSIEEVKQLMAEFQKFSESEVSPVAEKVEKLQASYRTVEETGHHELNQIRALANTLEFRWNQFDRDLSRRNTNLELSLKFQETLFEASNWCQKSSQFLNSMEEKIESCDTSPEATNLMTELTVYLSATNTEQDARVSQLNEISAYLHSNLLVELANQLEQSTAQIVQDFEQSQTDLEKLHSKLVQIEDEKDREKRLIKQRERVMEELLQTEETYADDLRLIVEKVRPRFVSELMPNSLKGKEGVIFTNIQEIDKFHRGVLLPKLRECVGSMDAMADVFVECAEEMSAVYVPYCKNKTASEELLASHRTYLHRVQSLFGIKVPISSLLIKPVQRITKYPLLLKDALRYTTELGQPTKSLEGALRAVEDIPVQTNNAIHLSYLENSEEKAAELGKLLYQGPLLVSEPKFGIKAEKERHVFAFSKALLFTRKVELGQAKFKYESKFKVPITPSLKIAEFVEGERCKFALTTNDHRMHLKASLIETKQDWVKALRTAILEKNKTIISTSPRSERRAGSLLAVDSWTKDLQTPSPMSSPVLSRKMNGESVELHVPPPLFEKYQVAQSYTAEGDHLSLSKGAIVEVLDNNIDGKWYVRTLGTNVDHGWVPSAALERLGGEDEFDMGKRSKKWVQITTGPLNATSDDEKWQLLSKQKGFGSHDIQSHQVIRDLRKVTFGVEEEEVGEGEEESSLDIPADRSKVQPPSPNLEANRKPSWTPTRNSSHNSPHNSPRMKRSYTEVPDMNHPGVMVESPRLRARRHTDAPDPTKLFPNHEASKPNGSADWMKSQWRRTPVHRRRSGRNSVSSESSPKKMLHSSSSDEAIHAAENENARTSTEISEEDMERVQKAQQKLQYIMMELMETEKEYVLMLDQCINGYVTAMHSPNLPDALKGKEKLVFGNIQAVYEFHHGTFLHLLEEAKESLEDIAKCFLDQASNFEVYVTYCENKPKSESFLWTYQHTGGTFFDEVQNQLGHRQGLASYLIKPVQRITKYQLLLRDLHKSAQKANLPTPNLERALQLMQDVPKRANDAMALSMIYGYEGNIHANGQIILQDEFTVYERSRWTGARRHIFLLDQRLIITKEKDADGLYVYKDSLKVHSLSVAEKEGDNPCRFAVGTGPIGSWDQYYVLEAGSSEKKQQWVQAIKDILKQQFELLKALKPNTIPRCKTLDAATLNRNVALIYDSEEEGEDEEMDPGSAPSSPALWGKKAERLRAQTMATFGETTPSSPLVRPLRPLNLFTVAEDCAPPKENEGILYIHKGEVYDVIDDASDWWFARLVRDSVGVGSERLGEQGWVPGSFLDRFHGELSWEEEAEFESAVKNRGHFTRQARIGGLTGSLKHSSKKSPHRLHKKLHITSSFGTGGSEEEEEEDEAFLSNPNSPERKVKAPSIITHLSDETVIIGRSVKFQCQITETIPMPTVEWSHDGQPLNIDRAFTSIGDESCVLRIKLVERGDSGLYCCTIRNEHGTVTSSAKLVVLSPPSPPSKPVVHPLTSSSVSLTWSPPTLTGHSPITLYLIECKDTFSDRWSTLMKRITEPSTVVDDLMPGADYVFRVIAGNHIGSSEPSEESDRISMARSCLEAEFLLDPFEEHYELLEEIGRGQYSMVYECLHRPTQQSYAAKMIYLDVGREHAQHELEMLGRLSHPNIVQMTSAYLTENAFVILFHMLRGEGLFDFFIFRDCLTESTAASSFEQLLSALCYLHNSGIVHLSIKPENIMAIDVDGTDVPEIKLIHFERAREIDRRDNLVVPRLEDHVEYEAPEILVGESVTMATDVWSLGVVIYTLLSGSSPFLVDSLDLTMDNIKNVRYSFPVKTFREISENAKDFIAKALVRDPSKRMASCQCLNHDWISSISSNSSPKLSTTKLKSYLSSQKWQNSLVRGTNYR